MDNEIDKFLTEAMGECWHEPRLIAKAICKKCGRWKEVDTPENNDFSTWQGFGKLWEWTDKQPWIYDFTRSLDIKVHGLPLTYIHPDRFADALYHFLKEKNL